MAKPKTDTSTLPAQSMEAEQAVIGACLVTDDGFEQAAEVIKLPEVFYHEFHQQVWRAMTQLANRGVGIDIITVLGELPKVGCEGKGTPALLAELSMKVSSTAHLQHHSILLLQKWMQRSLAPLGNDLLTSAFDDKQDPLEVIDQTRGKLDALVDQVDQNNDKTTVELMSEMFREVERISQNDGTLVGIDTGFRELNHLTGGWQKGDLIIIGARPGMGKTAFAIRQAIAAAKAGHGVAFFSYEMTPEQLMKRVVSNESETIHANMLFKHGIHKDHQWTSLMETMQQIEKWSGHLHILQRFGDVNELAMAVRKYKRRSKVDLVIVDYIQLIAPPKAIRSNANREQEVSYTSRQLKRLAQELGISVMALSQLSRQLETRAEKRPRLSDLRESGAIEQDADVIGFLYRENYYNGDADPNVAEVIISKQRNGGQDIITAGYDANHVRYYDLQTETPYVNEDPAF